MASHPRLLDQTGVNVDGYRRCSGLFVVSILGRKGRFQLKDAFDNGFWVQGVDATDAFEFVVEVAFDFLDRLFEDGIEGSVLVNGIALNAEFGASAPELESVVIEELEEGCFLVGVEGLNVSVRLQKTGFGIYCVIRNGLVHRGQRRAPP